MPILKIIKKVLNKLVRIIESKEEKDAFFDVTKIDKTTILLGGLNIDFRIGKEKRTYLTIGEKCLISSKFIFEALSGSISIGNNVHIGGAMFLCRTNIEIHNDVTMAWGITIYDHNSHSIYWDDRKEDNHNCYDDYLKYNGNNIVNKNWDNVISKPIVIHSKVWIGFNVTILKGVTIGEGAVIGACSVVTKDVEPWTVVGGNPAVLLKKLK